MGRFPPFGAQFSLGGHVHTLAGKGGFFWFGSRFLPPNSGVKTKKRFSVRNLRLRLSVHSCFSSWHDMLLTIGGAQAPKCTPVVPGLLLSFGAQSSLERAHFSLGGTNSDLEGTAPKCPRGENSPNGAYQSFSVSIPMLRCSISILAINYWFESRFIAQPSILSLPAFPEKLLGGLVHLLFYEYRYFSLNSHASCMHIVQDS